MSASRICKNCGGVATVYDDSGDFTVMVCQDCGHTFKAHVGRFEQWRIQTNLKNFERIEFLKRRKVWAREEMKKAGLNNPGDQLVSTFEGYEFDIVIGPRRGVRIIGYHQYEFKRYRRYR